MPDLQPFLPVGLPSKEGAQREGVWLPAVWTPVPRVTCRHCPSPSLLHLPLEADGGEGRRRAVSRVDHWRETLVFFPKLPHFFFFFTVMKMMYFIFFIYFCIRVELTYSVVSISAVQRRDPVISIYTFFFLRCLPSCSIQLSTCPTFSADPPSPPGPPAHSLSVPTEPCSLPLCSCTRPWPPGSELPSSLQRRREDPKRWPGTSAPCSAVPSTPR